MNFKRYVAASALFLLPVIAVFSFKQTKWGPLLSTPAARQLGEGSAKVVIVEFSDFQCPMCAKVEPAIRQLMETYKGKVRFVYKYYPLTRVHKNAMPAAHAAECAAAQKKFWPFHDRLFETQTTWATMEKPSIHFTEIAKTLNLDMTQYAACYDDMSRRVEIEKDAQEAGRRQVAATPTFFINDERLVGEYFMADGARAVEKALRQ